MAEHEQETEAEAVEALDQASPSAVSMALGRTSKGGKSLDAKAEAFLEKQGRLIDLQAEHLHEQRELTLARLRWGRFSDRMKALLQVMAVVVGLIVAIGVGWMAWDAANERGLVIEPFSVPPDLAQKGLTGQVIASKMLDRLGAMQKATKSQRAASTYANNWNDEIKVEIPETGVSVGELRRLLVHWLGHQTTISGELYRPPAGIALSARAGTASAATHAGTEADLDGMIQQAAEDVYGATQPYRYATWIAQKVDPQSLSRAMGLYRALSVEGDPIDRIWAFNGLAAVQRKQGDINASIRTIDNGLALEPHFFSLYFNLATAMDDLGHNEALLSADRNAALMLHRYGRRFVTPAALRRLTAVGDSNVAHDLGDFGAESTHLTLSLSQEPWRSDTRMWLVEALALDHDRGGARGNAAMIQAPDANDPSAAAAADRLDFAQLKEAIARAEEDWSGFAAAFKSVDEHLLTPEMHVQRLTSEAPWFAFAMARLGDLQGAQAVIATTPMDCYLCTRMRGRIAAEAHDWPAAERWFAEAVRQAPSIPFAYADWGQMLLSKGDVESAIAKLQIANAKGPHFADALELWGEALMRKGDFAGAAVKFAEADKYAPKWERNHAMWGQALAKVRTHG